MWSHDSTPARSIHPMAPRFFFVNTDQYTVCTYEIHEGYVHTIQVFFVIYTAMRLTYV